ncbi:MAG: hypothetical protein AB9869_14725 [Verrucomicrobiia bacterium]
MTFRNSRFLAAILAGSAILATNNVNADFALGTPVVQGGKDILTALQITKDDLGELLYKNERDGDKEFGSLKDSYFTTYYYGAKAGTATISWVKGQPEAEDPSYLLAKAATVSLVWDLSGWNGMDPINIPAFAFNGNGKAQDISHVEFYGVTSFHTTVVPEPSTIIGGSLLLLPFALSAFRNWRRRSGQA